MRYVFDLDGTLCQTEGMDYADAQPDKIMIALLNGLHDAGHTIIIDTARGSGTGTDWQEATANQLRGWGVKYHELRTGVKIPADMYIDDRALTPGMFRLLARLGRRFG